MQWGNLLIGAMLLLFGRRLFWLFVGGIGFLVGFNFASQAFAGQPPWVILLIAAAIGLLAAIASIFLQRVVVAIAGFFAGAYFLSAAAVVALHSTSPAVTWGGFIIGGIIGAILTAALLDPALILLSSLAGATAITQSVSVAPSAVPILFVALVVIGIVVQAAQYSYARRPPPQPRQTE